MQFSPSLSFAQNLTTFQNSIGRNIWFISKICRGKTFQSPSLLPNIGPILSMWLDGKVTDSWLDVRKRLGSIPVVCIFIFTTLNLATEFAEDSKNWPRIAPTFQEKVRQNSRGLAGLTPLFWIWASKKLTGTDEKIQFGHRIRVEFKELAAHRSHLPRKSTAKFQGISRSHSTFFEFGRRKNLQGRMKRLNLATEFA